MKPFLKWAGGKYKIIDRVREKLPNGARLIEPFVGSGAVFMNTDYSEYLLADANPDLINVFQHVQSDADFINYAERFFCPENNQESVFYEFRQTFNATDNLALKAALFIYLNRHCFNGLCRYNAKGGFNVPFGRYTRPTFPKEELLAFRQKSQNAIFQCATFEQTMLQAKKGDVVYCDPPYVPLSATSSFTSYTQDGFTQHDQKKLADLANHLMSQGVCVVISNHDTIFTREVYAAAQIEAFDVQRFISSKVDNRTKAAELLAVFA